MSRLHALIPPGRLERIRLASVIFGIIALAGQAAVGLDDSTPDWIWPARAALLLVAVIFVATYRRGRGWWWEPILLPTLTLGVATTLDQPVASVGMIIAAIVVPSLYGSFTSWAVRSLTSLTVLPLAIAITPVGLDLAGSDVSVALLALPQIVLMAVLTRAIYGALVEQERAAAREMAVARAGTRMVVATRLDEIFQIGADAMQEVAAHSPGVAMVLLERRRDGAVVVSAAGLPGRPPRRVLPEAALTDPEAEFGSAAPGYRAWCVEPLPSGRIMVIGARRRMPAGLREAIRTLSAQVQLAETLRRSHDQLEDRANHDHLTRLPTRAKFFRTVDDAVERDEPETVALLTVDLDDFKRVNDTYGHAAGDELLVEVAERLAHAAGPVGLAGRLGGDEFVVLLRGLSVPADAEPIAEQLCARLAAPVTLSAATVRVGASIGVALTEPGVGATELTRRADIAMYSAKARGKNRVAMFTTDEHGEAARFRTLENQLRDAAGRGEIAVSFQPYREVGTGWMTGVEALFRWQPPGLAAVNCRELLMLAERAGELAAVTAHVLRMITSEVARLDDRLPVGLNVGGHQILDPRFTEAVLATLAGSGLAPGRLVLELLEYEHLNDPAARAQLARLTGHGVRLALDDFGTGDIALPALRAFPVHQLKIAPEFLDDDPGTLELMVSMGALLNARTVVLGVTTDDQLGRARATGADAAQGDLVAPIVDATQLAELLAGQGVPAR